MASGKSCVSFLSMERKFSPRKRTTERRSQATAKVRIKERLRQVLEAFGSDVEIANRLGVDRTSIRPWREGSSAPSAPQLARIAVTLGVNADWLLTGEGTPQREHMTDSVQGLEALAQALNKRVNESATSLGPGPHITADGLFKRLCETLDAEVAQRAEWWSDITLRLVVSRARAAILKRGRELTDLTESDMYLAGKRIEQLEAVGAPLPPPSIVLEPPSGRT